MTTAIVAISVPLIVEWVFAPVNLWTGRTMPNFTRFTGLPPQTATHVLAPIKLATALALTIGLAIPAASVAGALATLGICGFYLLRLTDPGRRDPAGLGGFTIFGGMALALLVLRT